MDAPQPIYCHDCNQTAPRGEGHRHLTCPNCHSEFTEIIPPGDEQREGLDAGPLGHPHDDHFPLRHPIYPGRDGTVEHLNWTTEPDGSFHVSGTIFHGARQTNAMNPFQIMFEGLLGAAYAPNAGGRQTFRTGNDPHDIHDSPEFTPGFARPRASRSPDARRQARDANNQNRLDTPEDLATLLGRVVGELNRPPGPSPPSGGAEIQNPIAHLMSSLFGVAPLDPGDVAFSNEHFDQIISDIMEQNPTGNGPPPASAEAIAALPKKKLDEGMLDENGKAECTICQDEVILGEEVTNLYCDHWFHEHCIGIWLAEHDTCPHCRVGITEGKDAYMARSTASTQASNQASASNQGSSHRSSSRSRSRLSVRRGESRRNAQGSAQEEPSRSSSRRQSRSLAHPRTWFGGGGGGGAN